MAQGMIVLGRIVGPYGLHGWVKLHPMGDDFGALGAMPNWWLAKDAENATWQPYELESLKEHGKGWIVKFVGLDDRTGAEGIAGKFVGAPREALPKTEADEYYWADLVGLEVVNKQGERLGKITGLLSCGAHEVLCVRGANEAKERLLPFVAQVVKNVDRASGTILVEWGADW